MPIYRVTAIEKFAVRTQYDVEADSPEEAERLCMEGEVGYDDKEIEEGMDEWIETVSIEEVEDKE